MKMKEMKEQEMKEQVTFRVSGAGRAVKDETYSGKTRGLRDAH